MIPRTRRMILWNTDAGLRGLKIELGGEEMTLRMVEAESILAYSDERPSDLVLVLNTMTVLQILDQKNFSR